MANVEHPRLAWLSAGVGALGLACLTGAAFVAYRCERAFNWTPSASLLTFILILPIAWWLGRRFAFGGRGPVAASLALMGLTPIIVYAVKTKLVEALIVGDHYSDFDENTILLSIGIVAVSGVAVGSWVATLVARASPERMLRTVAMTAWAIVTICLILATYRTVWFPDADGYVASLPKVGEVPAYDEIISSEMPIPPPLISDGLTVTRHASCGELEIATRSASITSHGILNCRRQVVRRDTQHDLWVFEQHEGVTPSVAPDGSVDTYVPIRAYRPSVEGAIAVYPRDLTDTLAPPHGWTLCALIAWVASLFVAWRALRHSRELEERALGKTGTHRGEGWVDFDDGSAPLHSPEIMSRTLGRKVIVIGQSNAGGGYRDGGAIGGQVIFSTPEELRESARASRTFAYAFVVGALGLGAAPLVTEALAHLFKF
jgi:hypothetical protein